MFHVGKIRNSSQLEYLRSVGERQAACSSASLKQSLVDLYARYLCSRDALGLKAAVGQAR